MTYFCRLMLWLSRFELTLARSAPVPNPHRVRAAQEAVDEWELILFKRENKFHP